jgi:hypothetical protein
LQVLVTVVRQVPVNLLVLVGFYLWIRVIHGNKPAWIWVSLMDVSKLVGMDPGDP